MSYIKRFIYLTTLILTFGCSEQAVEVDNTEQPKLAERILFNAKIYSLSWPEPALDGTPSSAAPYTDQQWTPDAQAIAIVDGKILALGSDKNIMLLKNPDTELIDMNGATIIPGLVDSHTHIIELGKLLHIVNITDARDPQHAIEMVKEFAKDIPQGEWVIGQGWDEGAWANNYPNRQMLDEVFPNNPVFLRSLHSFAIWVNSKAMEVAVINKSTEAPVGGEIVRTDAGEPTGIFLNRATTMFESVLPKPNIDTYKQYIRDAMLKMAEDGFVSVHEAGVNGLMMEALQALRKEDKLPLRMYAMLSSRDFLLSKQWIKTGPVQDKDGFLDVVSVKAFYDGALGSRGARLLEDYSDKEGHKGVSGDDYGFDKDIVDELIKAGFQIGIHAIGDAGNREVLAYFADHIKADPNVRTKRHRIEHAQVVHPDDFKYFKQLGVIASLEPPHAVEDKTWAEQRLGPERIKNAYAWRTFRNNNVKLTFNSDLPGSDHGIFYGLHAAVTRQDKDSEPEGGWYPEQIVTIEEAIRGYTQWAAYAGFRENQTGVLKPGNWADITVFDIDPFQLATTNPKQLFEGKVLMTMVNGEVVYQRKK